jgi:hypothetical protein
MLPANQSPTTPYCMSVLVRFVIRVGAIVCPAPKIRGRVKRHRLDGAGRSDLRKKGRTSIRYQSSPRRCSRSRLGEMFALPEMVAEPLMVALPPTVTKLKVGLSPL